MEPKRPLPDEKQGAAFRVNVSDAKQLVDSINIFNIFNNLASQNYCELTFSAELFSLFSCQNFTIFSFWQHNN